MYNLYKHLTRLHIYRLLPLLCEIYLHLHLHLQEQKPSKTGKIRSQNLRCIFKSLFAHTKIRSKNTPPFSLNKRYLKTDVQKKKLEDMTKHCEDLQKADRVNYESKLASSRNKHAIFKYLKSLKGDQNRVGGNRSKEQDRKSELVLRSTIPNF